MSSTSAKNILLSQPKIGQGDTSGNQTLTHTVTRDEKSTSVKIEIPGVDPSTVQVNCEGTLLRVHCEKGELVYPLDPLINFADVKANILWGMLTLTIPVPAPPEPHSVKVSIYDSLPAKKTTTAKNTPKTEEFTLAE